MNPITGLLAALAGVTAVFVGGWMRSLAALKTKVRFPSALQVFIGAFTDFFDALGIGSYATTTALFRFFKVVDLLLQLEMHHEPLSCKHLGNISVSYFIEQFYGFFARRGADRRKITVLPTTDE